MPERIASRELDAEIAEKVMGWKWARPPESARVAILIPGEAKTAAWQKLTGAETRYTSFHNVPRYSTEVAAAWLVVERMREREPLFFELHGVGSITHKDAVLKPYERFAARFVSDLRPTPFSVAPTAPLAICRAALKALDAQGDATEPEPSAGVE